MESSINISIAVAVGSVLVSVFAGIGNKMRIDELKDEIESVRRKLSHEASERAQKDFDLGMEMLEHRCANERSNKRYAEAIADHLGVEFVHNNKIEVVKKKSR